MARWAMLHPPVATDLVLIEDDAGDAVLVQALLEDDAHGTWRVRWARNLAEAAPFLARRPACVLLDLHLPDGVGLDALKIVLNEAPRAAVVVLTGMVDTDLGVAALAAGAQDYLVKQQVDEHLLSRSLRFALERKRADEAAQARLQNVRLEHSLLPTPDLNGAGLTWAKRYAPGGGEANVLGGDFFDAVHLPSGAVRAVIGDVCGHGPDEAALGVSLRISWRALALAETPDDQVLPLLDQVLQTERSDPDLFATVSHITISPDRSALTVRSAGHPPPLLLADGTALEVATEQGPPLGVFDDVEWPGIITPLPDLWTIVLYTDGLIEGRDGDGRWGSEGLTAAAPHLVPVQETSRLAGLVHALAAEAVRRHGGPLPDDLAILALSSAP
jgi:serine phosphatase RsbU (regulator of sigma subunit)